MDKQLKQRLSPLGENEKGETGSCNDYQELQNLIKEN